MASATTDYKPAIIDALTVLMKSDQMRKEKFKVIAYQKVLRSLAAHEGPLRSIEDLDTIEGVGTKIKAKIEDQRENTKKYRGKDVTMNIEEEVKEGIEEHDSRS